MECRPPYLFRTLPLLVLFPLVAALAIVFVSLLVVDIFIVVNVEIIVAVLITVMNIVIVVITEFIVAAVPLLIEESLQRRWAGATLPRASEAPR